jgi:hypothetical protein
MTIWVLNAAGLLAITVGALMVFLHLHRASRASASGATVEASSVTRERKLMRITLGLMSAWFVIEYLALIVP